MMFELGFWLLLAILLCVFRYTRSIVHSVANLTYSPTPIPKLPSLSPSDLVVILPTLGDDLERLALGISCHLKGGCQAVIVCVVAKKFKAVQELVSTIPGADNKVTTLKAEHRNKRKQQKQAITSLGVRPGIFAFADDDITYGHRTLHWVLAPFEDPKIGAAVPAQSVEPLQAGTMTQAICNWLFMDYIERRNFENIDTLAVYGSISCISGRFNMVRGDIICKPGFPDGLVSEMWRGRLLLADDDNYITRFLMESRWKIGFQNHSECIVETTFEPSIENIIGRNLRWLRSNWRSNWKSIRNSQNWT